jgi:hypothetical protein
MKRRVIWFVAGFLVACLTTKCTVNVNTARTDVTAASGATT